MQGRKEGQGAGQGEGERCDGDGEEERAGDNRKAGFGGNAEGFPSRRRVLVRLDKCAGFQPLSKC